MPADESIRTDASTVYQSGDPPADGDRSSTPSLEAGSSRSGRADKSSRGKEAAPEVTDPLAEERTVIRGSSAEKGPGDQPDAVGRTPADVAKVLLGQHLNQFRLDALIGGGGMGAVFRAQDEKLDRTVAIKVIPFVGDDPDLQRRFRNEAQSAAKLDHPRIAKVFDAGSHGQWHYIVFEYVEGTNIRDLVHRDGPMSVDEAVFYTSQLAGALQHASDRGIVHRDVKPSNVLIGSEGKITLVDMGLARSDNLDLNEDMTASGVTLGTFDYISPEQARDPRDADLRSDLYSLGCTLYFMLTGRPPYPGGTMLQKLLSHGNAPPPDVRQLRAEVSGNLAAVLQKMLAKNPSARYQAATDLIADLREVAMRDGLPRSQALGPIAVTPPNPWVSWLERHAPWLAATALLLVSTAWLQLESAASRDQLTIPSSAAPPLQISADVDVSRPGPPTEDESAAADPGAATPSGMLGTTSGLAPADSAAATSTVPRRVVDVAAQPPRFSDVQMPPELIASAGTEAGSELGPLMRTPLTDVPADPPIETLESTLPTVIRVMGPDLEPGYDRDADGAALASSLSGALELAARYEASQIEINVPLLLSEPLKVGVDDLVIRSTLRDGSVIMFQPNDSVAMERSKMFSIGSHPIELRNLHFVWSVPSGEIDGGTLFEIHDNHLIMTDCTITVSNPTLRDEVYAFDVITDPERIQPRSEAKTDPFPLVWIDMNNVAVRGQMTMLHMDYAAKLSLFWDNGLLAITETMIDTAGARRAPPTTAGPMQLSLTRLTAHAPAGLLRMRVGVSGAYPVAIDRFARKSVFVVDSGVPYFEISGLDALDEDAPLVRLRGASNVYVVEPSLVDPILRLETSDGRSEVTRMNDLLTAAPAWADEISPRWSASWANLPLTTAPTSGRRPADYRQDDPSPSGFDEKSMPRMPISESPPPVPQVGRGRPADFPDRETSAKSAQIVAGKGDQR